MLQRISQHSLCLGFSMPYIFREPLTFMNSDSRNAPKSPGQQTHAWMRTFSPMTLRVVVVRISAPCYYFKIWKMKISRFPVSSRTTPLSEQSRSLGCPTAQQILLNFKYFWTRRVAWNCSKSREGSVVSSPIVLPFAFSTQTRHVGSSRFIVRPLRHPYTYYSMGLFFLTYDCQAAT